MKTSGYVLAAIFSVCILLPLPASACNVCHSKNPKMVNMHRELEFRNCFSCHGQGLKKDPEEKRLQMMTDERCIRCHKK